MLGGAAITALAAHFSWPVVVAVAAGFGALSMLLLGVDAPESGRRVAGLSWSGLQ